MDNNKRERPTIEEILAAPNDPAEAEDDGSYSHYPLVTCEYLALLHLSDCLQQLEQSASDPIRLAQAAKSAHQALQSALTAAVAGSMNIGAYEPKLELQWLDFLQGDGEQPRRDRVMSFEGLLAKATSSQLEWHGRSLSVSAEEHELLRRLSFLRDRIEHPRPHHWLIDPAYIRDVLPIAVRLTREALEGLWHRFKPNEVNEIIRLQTAIVNACEVQSNPRSA